MAVSKPASKVKRGEYLATVPPQEIIPLIDRRYESSVKGIFVIGDVTGFPLVKVAANQGREVIELMDQNRVIEGGSDSEGLDLVIVLMTDTWDSYYFDFFSVTIYFYAVVEVFAGDCSFVDV